MPVYSSSDLKSRINNKSSIRKLELPDGVWKRIWIPFDAQLYHRIHFKVKTRTPFHSAKYDVMDCFNQQPGEAGKGCPICSHLAQLWAEWREAKKRQDDKRRKELQGTINSVLAEEFWLNCIDMDDPKLMFQAVRFTGPNFLAFEKIRDAHGVGKFILRYKKDIGTPTKYTLVDDKETDLVASLFGKLNTLTGRSYDEGGLCDLDRIARTYKDLDQYKSLLEGGDDPQDDNDDEVPNIAGVSSSTSHSQASNPVSKVNIDESDISIDSLGLDDPATPPASTEKKTETIGELDLDSLGLEDIKLEEPKFFEVTAISFKEKWDKEKVACEPWINKIYTSLFEEKKIQEMKDLPSKVKGIFLFLKSQTSPVKIKE